MNPRDLKTVGAGKGSRPRNNFSKKYRDNYDAIFRKPKIKSYTATVTQNVHGFELYPLVGSERKLWVHPRTKCAGQHCCIHNPSDHHMKDWPQNWREDRGIMERICPHGIGHPDPDDPCTDKIHGCDGCCLLPEEKLKEADAKMQKAKDLFDKANELEAEAAELIEEAKKLREV